MMNDDYLWDGSGVPDTDVERLEQMLGRLRGTSRVPTLPERFPRAMPVRSDPAQSWWRSSRFVAPAFAAAAAIIAMVGVTWQTTRSTQSWEVIRMAGQPRIGAAPLA